MDESLCMIMRCWFPPHLWVLFTWLQSITHIISHTPAHMWATQRWEEKFTTAEYIIKPDRVHLKEKVNRGCKLCQSSASQSWWALLINKEANSKSYRLMEDSLIKAERRRSDEETVLYYIDIDQFTLLLRSNSWALAKTRLTQSQFRVWLSRPEVWSCR